MDQLLLDSLTSDILKSFIEIGGKFLDDTIVNRLRKSRRVSKNLEDYLRRVTNRVSYFVTYRFSPQHISKAYVHPLVLDTALSQTYIEPNEYMKLMETLLLEAKETKEVASIAAYISAHLQEIEPRIQVNYISINDLSNEYQGLLVLGEAGAGKTALLSFLCVNRLNQKKPRLPVVIDARDIEKSSIMTCIYGAIDALEIDKKDLRWFEREITLYVDGLDELPPLRYKEVCVELAKICKEMPQFQMTVACRSAAYQGELSFLKEVALLPFNKERSEDFITRWFENVESGPKADGLIMQIRKTKRLSELSSHPLILALMCNAYRRYLNISKRQSSLFDQCVNSLLWKWDADRAIVRESCFSSLDLEKKKWLHSDLAVKLHEARKRFVAKEFATNRLFENLPKYGIPSNNADNVLGEICSHHGILVKWTEDTYGFSHLALQEFLTAKWYSEDRRWKRLITKETLVDPWWENVIALCFASLSDATDALDSIWKVETLSETERLKILSHCLKFDPLISSGFRNQIINKILHLLHNGTVSEHDAAIYMLVGIEDDWTSPIIKRSLSGKLPTKEMAKLLERVKRYS